MNKRKKHLIEFEILILMVLLTTGLHQSALAQVDPCSKPKVAVIMNVEEMNEGEFNKHLNEQYPSQPKGSWLYQIQEKVLGELRMNSPGTQFIPATGGIPSDCDYYLQCTFNLRGAGEDIEVAGLLHSEYTAYFMSSRLCQNSSCKNQNWCLNTETTLNRDIDKTIEQNIAAHGNIGDRIKKHEESHRVPPRGPEIKVSQDRDYVSPLEEERKLKIKIDVTNCKGEPVFDKNHGQAVTLSKETERGELECNPNHNEVDVCIESSNKLILIIQRPIGTSAIYALKKGTNPDEVSTKIETCGIDKEAVKETKIHIHGLEIKVKPEKKEVPPGDRTKVTVKLSEVDEKGAKQPVAGKHIQVQVKGLVNGHIHPSGDVTTDQNGKAILTYDAGDKDKKVVVKAKFQPKDYPESVKDESAITIAAHGANAFLEMDVTNNITGDDGSETLTARTEVMLKYSHTESFADEGVFIEHYDVISWDVSYAKAIIEVKTKKGHKTYKTNKVEKHKQENEILLIFYDSKTGKPKEVDLPNTGFEFIFDDLNGMRMTGPGFYDPEQKVKGGDGVHEMMGGESGSTGGMSTYTGKWKIQK